MKKISTFLFFFSFLLISIISYAQIGDTIITHDKGRVHKYTGTNLFPLLLHDYDNPDNNWIGLSKWDIIFGHNLYIYKVDNDLNILDSLENIDHLSIKYNNKFYGIYMDYYSVNYHTYYDTISLFCADKDANLLYKKVLNTYGSDTIKYWFGYSKVFFTKDKNFGIFQRCIYDNNEYYKFILYDTLGNTLNSKLLRLEGMDSYADIIETNTNFELHYFFSENIEEDSAETKIYFLNKNTLEIYDSITGFDSIIRPNNVFNLNDSIYITFGKYNLYIDGLRKLCEATIKIVNRNTKEIKPIGFILDDFTDLASTDYYPEFTRRFDYINTDSMYMVVFSPDIIRSGSMTTQDQSVSNKIKIINFNINGVLNYEYDFDFDTTKWKQITGVKATSDGGLIISYIGSYEWSYFIKFMPNGFVGLSNVETGERASLKVYPNPARDFVLVDIEADRFLGADIEIYDLGGRMVKGSRLSAKVGNRIDVSDLKAGVYGYRVELNGKGVSGKIVIGE